MLAERRREEALSNSTGKPLSSSPRRGEGWLACEKEAGGSPLQLYRKAPLQLSPPGRGLACLRKGGGRKPSPTLQESPSPTLPTRERAGWLAKRRREEALKKSFLPFYPFTFKRPSSSINGPLPGGERWRGAFLPFYPFTFLPLKALSPNSFDT